MSDADQRKKGFTIGYLAGLCGMPLAIAPGIDVSGKWSYNGVVLPSFEDATDVYHKLAIMKDETADVYILYDAFIGMYYVNYYNQVFLAADIINSSAFVCPAGGNAWKSVPILDYAEKRVIDDFECYYIGRFENFIWTEENAYSFGSAATEVRKYGTEPVVLYNADNKAIMIGCRLGYIVRSQMGKGNVEIPSGVLISSDGYILTDCNGVYLIAAADDEPDEPDEPAVPDEPGEVATMYLYGTPSESGNIGLRSGDTVTLYDGAVLSALPESDLPCGTLVNANGTYVVNLTNTPLDAYNTGTVSPRGSGEMFKYEDGKWVETRWVNYPANYPAIWTNYDLYYKTTESYGELSGTLCRAKTDAIPVGEIVEYINDIPIYEKKEDI